MIDGAAPAARRSGRGLRLAVALGWLRWRLLIAQARGKRRDALERVSRLLQLLIPVLLAAILLPAALGLGVMAGVTGFRAPQDPRVLGALVLGIRATVLPALLMALLAPLLRDLSGAGARLTRLLLLPIPRSWLHAAETLGAVVDPWIAILLPAAVALPCGLWLGGSRVAAVLVLAACVAAVALLAGLSGACSHGSQLLLRNRRRGELVIVAAALLLSLLGFLPALLLAPRAGSTGLSAEPAPGLLRLLPQELLAETARQAVEGRLGWAAASAAGLALGAAGIHALSLLAWRRLLDAPGSGGRRGIAREAPSWRRLPGLSPAATAVARAQWMAVTRTVRGRLALWSPPLIAVLFAVLSRRGSLGAALAGGHVLVALGICFSLLSLQALSFNQFATDGPGLTLEVVMPIRPRDLVLGKAVALGAAALAASSASLAALALWSPARVLPLVPAGLLIALSATGLIAPLAAAASAVFPRRSRTESLGHGGNPHQAAALLGTLGTLAVVIPPLLLHAVVREHRGPWIALAGAACWAAACLVAGRLGLAATAGVVGQRRENLALVASLR